MCDQNRLKAVDKLNKMRSLYSSDNVSSPIYGKTPFTLQALVCFADCACVCPALMKHMYSWILPLRNKFGLRENKGCPNPDGNGQIWFII